MTLSSKILNCRKKAGLSQEALADMIGVSRQAVSKWENGEAVPEVGKLLLLAKAFQVTTDWLLSEEEPEQEPSEGGESTMQPPPQRGEDWVESIPGVIGKLIRRYGWLYGVYIALGGLGAALVGGMVRMRFRQMISNIGAEVAWPDSAGKVNTNLLAVNNLYTFGTIIMVVGILVTIAGVILAIYLKKRGNQDK